MSVLQVLCLILSKKHKQDTDTPGQQFFKKDQDSTQQRKEHDNKQIYIFFHINENKTYFFVFYITIHLYFIIQSSTKSFSTFYILEKKFEKKVISSLESYIRKQIGYFGLQNSKN